LDLQAIVKLYVRVEAGDKTFYSGEVGLCPGI